jgi:hypothetical protein
MSSRNPTSPSIWPTASPKPFSEYAGKYDRLDIRAASPFLFRTKGVAEAVDQLLASVQSQLAGRVCELQLLVMDNGVVLQGRAYSYYAKQLAQQGVMKTTGLPLLADDIEVLSPLPAKRG